MSRLWTETMRKKKNQSIQMSSSHASAQVLNVH